MRFGQHSPCAGLNDDVLQFIHMLHMKANHDSERQHLYLDLCKLLGRLKPPICCRLEAMLVPDIGPMRRLVESLKEDQTWLRKTRRKSAKKDTEHPHLA